MADLFGALRGMLRPLLVNPQLNLVFEDASDIPPLITDEGKVSQILRNFISNALEVHRERRGPRGGRRGDETWHLLGVRHRNRYRSGAPRAHLSGIRATGQPQPAQGEGYRSGPAALAKAGGVAGHIGWYADWQERMKADARLKWVVAARNQIVKQGDLDTHSKARVRIVGEVISGAAIDIDVEPAASAQEIIRRIDVGAMPRRVREEGTLVVERRWTVDQFPDDELLDVLAHCYAVISRVVAEAHEQFGGSTDTCEKTAEDPCGSGGTTAHPSGRPPCMWAGREARTSRRNLSSGAPTGVTMDTVTRRPPDIAALRSRYSDEPWARVAPDADVFERAAALHENGRRMLLVDGHHVMIAWLFRDGEPSSQQTLWPEDARDKYLMMERLAAEATRLGANELIITAEAWEATITGADDPQAHLRAGERQDRSEALITHALRRGGDSKTWRSVMTRTESGLRLEDSQVEGYVPPLLKPMIDAWAEWSPV